MSEIDGYPVWVEAHTNIETIFVPADKFRQMMAVVKAARLVLDHDCQSCREHWCQPREDAVMQLAIALDRVADVPTNFSAITLDKANQ